MAGRFLAVLEYHLVGYRRVWRTTVLSSFVMPVLMLLGLGLALGRFVHPGGALQVPYLRFVAPGLLALTGSQIAMLEAGFPVQSFFKWDRIYIGMAATPLRVVDMIAGQLGYIGLRVLVAASAFLAVMAALGAASSASVLLAPLVAVLVGVAIAAPLFAFSATVEGPYLMTVMFRFGMLPMTLFAGVFFPVTELPAALRPVAYALPLWHGVQLCQAAALGVRTSWPVAAHVGVLVLWAVAGFGLARVRFAKRLVV
jgi:lipooligosaccharide transport system permease protein